MPNSSSLAITGRHVNTPYKEIGVVDNRVIRPGHAKSGVSGRGCPLPPRSLETVHRRGRVSGTCRGLRPPRGRDRRRKPVARPPSRVAGVRPSARPAPPATWPTARSRNATPWTSGSSAPSTTYSPTWWRGRSSSPWCRARTGDSPVSTGTGTSGSRRSSRRPPRTTESPRRLACVSESALWLLPVAPDGTPSGEARRLSAEPADHPSWSADSRTLLYQSGARLRLLRLDVSGEPTGAPRTVPIRMSYRRPAPVDTVVHAGLLWDGTGAAPRADVDVLIRDGRTPASCTPGEASI